MRQGRHHVPDVDRGAAHGSAQGARPAGVRVPDPAHRAAVLHQEEGLGQRPLIMVHAISEKAPAGALLLSSNGRGGGGATDCFLTPLRTKCPPNPPEIIQEETMGTSITFKRPDGKDAG